MSEEMDNTPVVSERDSGSLAATGRSEAASGQDRVRLLVAAFWLHPRLALLVAALGLLIGGFAGYCLAPPAQYRSAGQIRIRPYMPRVLYQGEQNSAMPMFDSFAQAQVALIASRQVLDAAMQSESWKDTGIAATPKAKISVENRLTVDRSGGPELIEVAFTDTNPHVAMSVVKAVVEAYMKLYGASESEGNVQRTQILEERCTALSAELKATNQRIMTIADEFGSTALGRMYEFELDELNKLESELYRVQVALAGIASSSSSPAAATQAAVVQPRTVPVQLIARQDEHMRDLLQQKQHDEQELERLKLRYGPSHMKVEEVAAALRTVNRDIDQYAAEYEAARADGSIQSAAGAPYAMADVSQLRQRERNLQALIEGVRARMLDLGRKRLQIESLQRDAEEKQARLSEAKARIEQLNVESSMGGRIRVLNYGDEPLAPFKSRRGTLAGATGLLGAILGMGIVVGMGLADPRCRTIDDANSSLRARTGVLGVLPNLPEDLSDPMQAAIAAHYVHHIRAMLQISQGRSRATALAVTSAMPGSGKTSLTIALGLSFAASGARTLLIDCDMVGGGLTARMGAKVPAKLGQILRQSGLVTREQVRTAIERARQSGRRLGQQLVALGYISDEDLERALARQHATTMGLLDVLGGEDLTDCVAATQTRNLFILPLGAVTSEDVARLSPEAISRVLADAKGHFDTVLIDTGPVPGSIEAAMVTAEADQVVLVISRGESRTLVEQAIAHLQSLGADVAGAVFNRAEADDILASRFSSSVSQRSVGYPSPQAANSTALRLGPVAMTVASTARSEHEAPES